MSLIQKDLFQDSNNCVNGFEPAIIFCDQFTWNHIHDYQPRSLNIQDKSTPFLDPVKDFASNGFTRLKERHVKQRITDNSEGRGRTDKSFCIMRAHAEMDERKSTYIALARTNNQARITNGITIHKL